eukprot:311544_1
MAKQSIDDLIDVEEVYNDEGTAEFDLTVIHSRRDILKKVRKNQTVSEVIGLIKKEIINDESKSIDITAGGKTLSPNKTLSHYGFPKSSARANKVDIVYRANGGDEETE